VDAAIAEPWSMAGNDISEVELLGFLLLPTRVEDRWLLQETEIHFTAM
jgi:hypothetical protein